jgi:hypothetical protein
MVGKRWGGIRAEGWIFEWWFLGIGLMIGNRIDPAGSRSQTVWLSDKWALSHFYEFLPEPYV